MHVQIVSQSTFIISDPNDARVSVFLVDNLELLMHFCGPDIANLAPELEIGRAGDTEATY